MSAKGRAQHQKLNQAAAMSFWFETRFTRKTLDYCKGTYLYLEREGRYYALPAANVSWLLS